MTDSIRSYEDLVAWQKAYQLALAIYRATEGFPRDEQFGLRSQLRRAAVSIPSNIAEGWGRQSTGDYDRFLRIARASSFQVKTQAMLAADLGFLHDPEKLIESIVEVQKVLSGLIRSLNPQRQ